MSLQQPHHTPRIQMVTIPKEQFDKLCKDVHGLCNDVCDLKTAVCGDEEFKVDGLIATVQSLIKWRDSMALKVAFLSGFVSCVGFVIKYLLTGKW